VPSSSPAHTFSIHEKRPRKQTNTNEKRPTRQTKNNYKMEQWTWKETCEILCWSLSRKLGLFCTSLPICLVLIWIYFHIYGSLLHVSFHMYWSILQIPFVRLSRGPMATKLTCEKTYFVGFFSYIQVSFPIYRSLSLVFFHSLSTLVSLVGLFLTFVGLFCRSLTSELCSHATHSKSVLHCVAAPCHAADRAIVLQCVAVCCSVL